MNAQQTEITLTVLDKFDPALLTGILQFWMDMRNQNGEFANEAETCRRWIAELELDFKS